MFRIVLDDKSFIIVDGDYELNLFHKDNLNNNKVVKVKEYKHQEDYFLCDYVNGFLLKTSFYIEQYREINDYPKNIRLKYNQDIEIGDYVIYKDNTPKRVTTTHIIEDDSYELIIDGISQIVNGNHILRLKVIDTNEYMNMPVNVYLTMNDEFKQNVYVEKVKL